MNYIEKILNDFEDDFGPSSTVLESRPMFKDGGMLVQPSVDGPRPGDKEDKRNLYCREKGTGKYKL